MSPTSQSATKDAGSFTINVTSNICWRVVADHSWCTVGTASGEDNGSISVNYTENTTESARSASITVTIKDGMVQTVSVSQAGIPAVNNPFVGAWKDAAYDNGSYVQYTFNANMTFIYFFYNGTDGTSETANGSCDYSETTYTLSLIVDGENDATSYNFVDATTLVIGGYTYFKQ